MSVVSVGVLVVTISIVILISCLILHFRQHFTFRCCNHSNYQVTLVRERSNEQLEEANTPAHSNNILKQLKSNESIRQLRSQLRCCLIAIDDDFGFFPISHL
eukprot:294583_1